MRYQVRKNNGVWHVFDTEEYSVVEAVASNKPGVALGLADLLNAKASE
jgi:hypothetical protein